MSGALRIERWLGKTSLKRRAIQCLTLLILWVSVGCAQIRIPEKAYYREVLNMPYAGKYDCKAKAKLYWSRLREKGYDARMAIGTIEGDGHCWVEYTEEGVTRLVDPSIADVASGYPKYTYRDYEVEFYFSAKQDAGFAVEDYE